MHKIHKTVYYFNNVAELLNYWQQIQDQNKGKKTINL